MEEQYTTEHIRYRGRDLLNSQKKLLYQRVMELIGQEQGELAYLLDCKEKNYETHTQYKKRWEWLRANEQESPEIQELEEKMKIIDTTQGQILLAMQPLFKEKFDQAAEDIPPGKEYNDDELQQYVRFDFIFGERDIPGPGEGSREHYRIEQRYRSSEESYRKRLEKLAEKRKKLREQIRLPLDHHLITEKNYERYAKRISKHMERAIPYYKAKLGLDANDKAASQKLIEKYFAYFFIRVLIEEKFIFNIKSTRGGKCLDATVDVILIYFESIFGQKPEIHAKDIKKRLWSNLNSGTMPMDISYKNAILEDVEFRETYMNTTYFNRKKTTADSLRIQIMQEYNAQKGVREATFELINPRYHIYKDQVEKHQKHLKVLQEYQKRTNDQDPHLQQIVEDIQQKLSYAQEQKKEHTVFEEDKEKIKPTYDHNLTEIQQRFMKRYQVPVQYRHIFGVIMNKINNFYQIKIGLIKKADEANAVLVEQMMNSEGTDAHIMYLLRNYITNKQINDMFDRKREKKRSERKTELSNIIQDLSKKEEKIQHVRIEKDGKRQKIQPMDPLQMTIDFGI